MMNQNADKCIRDGSSIPSKIHLPRIMFAAPSSGSGKTMITCGILQALSDRGLRPASFKCGPDYIDPMFHSKVIGTKSKNLDTFFTDRETTRYLFARTAKEAGISVLEGVMGFFDGIGGTSVKASSYDLASITDTPVILIVNARGMSLSVIPLIKGYLEYQEQFGKKVIKGVILNQTTKMTYLMLKEKIEQQTGIRLLGYVPRMDDCVIESRHLGLVTPDEISGLQESLKKLSTVLEECIDFEELLSLAQEAEDFCEKDLQMPEAAGCCKMNWNIRPRIAVAKDEAFCFYYEDNLELLRMLGTELVPFSPLRDPCLPENIGGLLLGGGYPELYAEALEKNKELRHQIRQAIEDGLPYLAECGGFMYLHESMEDMDKVKHEMCGVVKGESYHTPKLGRFGYIELSVNTNAGIQLLKEGDTIRGHEFHYFDSTNPGSDYIACKPSGKRSWECITGTGRSAAGYPHLYYWSNPSFAAGFVRSAAEYTAKII